jgi:hypothetical protein
LFACKGILSLGGAGELSLATVTGAQAVARSTLLAELNLSLMMASSKIPP